jgi:hypothetical protein
MKGGGITIASNDSGEASSGTIVQHLPVDRLNVTVRENDGATGFRLRQVGENA